METIRQTGLFSSSVQVKEAKFPLREILASISRKALFLVTMPFYWLVFFTRLMNWFDLHFFVFVVAVSIALSIFGKNWGLLHFLAR